MSEPIAIALIGVAGAVIGSVATMAGSVLLHWKYLPSKGPSLLTRACRGQAR